MKRALEDLKPEDIEAENKNKRTNLVGGTSEFDGNRANKYTTPDALGSTGYEDRYQQRRVSGAPTQENERSTTALRPRHEERDGNS